VGSRNEYDPLSARPERAHAHQIPTWNDNAWCGGVITSHSAADVEGHDAAPHGLEIIRQLTVFAWVNRKITKINYNVG
jgi:hypothetical protein